MAMKGHSVFPKALGPEPHLVSHLEYVLGAYSTALDDRFVNLNK